MSSSTSHKKKKRTAVNVKQENAVLAKKCRLKKRKPLHRHLLISSPTRLFTLLLAVEEQTRTTRSEPID